MAAFDYNPIRDPSAQRLMTGQPMANLSPDFLSQLGQAGAMGHLTGPGGLTYGQVGVQSSGEDGGGFTPQGYQAWDPNHDQKGDPTGLFGLNGNFAQIQTNDNGKYDGWWAPLAVYAAATALGGAAGAGAGAGGAPAAEGAGAAAFNPAVDSQLANAAIGSDAFAGYGVQGAGGLSAAGTFNPAMDSQLANSAIGSDALGGYGGAANGATGVTGMGAAGNTGTSVFSKLSSLSGGTGGAGYANLLGALAGAVGSGSAQGGTTSINKAPWAPAIPWLLSNLQTGQNLQNQYQQNPFNAIQKGAYGNMFGQGDYINQMVPGLLSQFSQSSGFDRNNPRGRPAAYNFGTAPTGQPLAGLLGPTIGG